jgi:hypothetical protein
LYVLAFLNCDDYLGIHFQAQVCAPQEFYPILPLIQSLHIAADFGGILIFK